MDRKIVCVIFCIGALTSRTMHAQLFPNLGGQRTGISSFTFLKNDLHPAAIGVAGAHTTLKGDPYAAAWNPAALTETGNHSAAVCSRIFGLGITQHFAAFNVRLRETDYLSVHVNNMNSGTMEIRTEFQPNGTGQFFSFNGMSAGISYAKALTYKFSLGTSIKYIQENFDIFRTHTVAVDLGFVYRTDFKDLRFGVFLQNFGPNARAEGNYTPTNFRDKIFKPDEFPLPTLFKFGGSIVPLKTALHTLTTAVELNHPSDNASNIRFGAEYTYQNFLYLRTGYGINLANYPFPTAGVGIHTHVKGHKIQISYAFAAMPVIGINHNVGLSVNLNPSNPTEPVNETN